MIEATAIEPLLVLVVAIDMITLTTTMAPKTQTANKRQ